MVGDDLVNDVESAKAAGIAAIHLRRAFFGRPAGGIGDSELKSDHLKAELRTLSDLLEILP